MPRDVTEPLKDFWGDPEALPPVLRHRYDIERELRLATNGHIPDGNEWIVEIRSGGWHKRQERNAQNFRRNQARLAQLKRDGYSFDQEHRLVAPMRAPVPARRARGTSRARRARRRTSRACSSRGDPDPPGDDDPDVVPRRRREVAA